MKFDRIAKLPNIEWKTLENYPRFTQQNAKYISPEILHDQILCWLHYLELNI